MCWVVNLERKNLKLEFLDYKKYSSFTFIDPSKHLFGFTIPNPHRPQKQRVEKEQETESAQEHSLEKRFKRSVDLYKQAAEEREKSMKREREQELPSKHSLSMTYNLTNEKRHSIANSTGGAYKNQLGHPHRKTEHNKTIDLKSIGPIESFRPKYDNRGFKPLAMSPRMSLGGSSELTTPTHNKSSSLYQELGTDRSGGKKSSGGNPLSTRTSGSREQDRFYRRVKDIMRK
jgi:hypothetical protein